MLVVADGDKAKSDALATKLGEEMVSMRGKTMPEFLDTVGGVAAGLAFNAAPVVIAEPSDNAGGGAPSDNTSILRELMAHNADNVALGPMWDRWPCGCASIRASAHFFHSASAARSGPRPGRRSMPRWK